MATRPKKTPLTAPLKVVTIKVTAAEEQILEQLSQDATDRIGRPVSNSALIRALIRYAGKQTPAWAVESLHPVIEEEIGQGRVWGSTKQR